MSSSIHWYRYNIDGINDDQVIQYRSNKILREIFSIGSNTLFQIYNISGDYLGYGRLHQSLVSSEMTPMNNVSNLEQAINYLSDKMDANT
jgi:hypothetical protein